jgi:hypothetical protein
MRERLRNPQAQNLRGCVKTPKKNFREPDFPPRNVAQMFAHSGSCYDANMLTMALKINTRIRAMMLSTNVMR